MDWQFLEYTGHWTKYKNVSFISWRLNPPSYTNIVAGPQLCSSIPMSSQAFHWPEWTSNTDQRTIHQGCPCIYNNAQYVTLEKYFSHPRFSHLSFPTETGTANSLEISNSNPLGPIELSCQLETINKCNLTVFIRLFQGSSRSLMNVVQCFRGHNSLPANPLDLTAVPHPRFPV